MKHIIGDYETHLARVNNALRKWGIDQEELAGCDHLAYRVETMAQYKDVQAKLGRVASSCGEVLIAGRPIDVFELPREKWLRAGGWVIPYIELPAPKEDSPYHSGLEHVEFVVQGSLPAFHRRHKELSWVTKALSHAINPALGLKDDSTGASVKFHQISIGAVIDLEIAAESA